MDQVFKALADPSRRKLLDRLYARNGSTLAQLCVRMRMSRQAVSQHLAVLEAANLVSVEWRGREKLHYLNPVPIHEIYDRWVRKFEHSALNVLAAIKAAAEGDERGNREVRVRDLHRRKSGARLGRAGQG